MTLVTHSLTESLIVRTDLTDMNLVSDESSLMIPSEDFTFVTIAIEDSPVLLKYLQCTMYTVHRTLCCGIIYSRVTLKCSYCAVVMFEYIIAKVQICFEKTCLKPNRTTCMDDLKQVSVKTGLNAIFYTSKLFHVFLFFRNLFFSIKFASDKKII